MRVLVTQIVVERVSFVLAAVGSGSGRAPSLSFEIRSVGEDYFPNVRGLSHKHLVNYLTGRGRRDSTSVAGCGIFYFILLISVPSLGFLQFFCCLC